MKSLKQAKKPVIIGLLGLVVLAGAGLSYLVYTSNRQSGVVQARVSQVIDRPNRVEDGYYGFVVVDSGGNSYNINAAPYLNVAPDSSTITTTAANHVCLDVPKLQVNDQIKFNLPKSGDNLTTCFSAGSGNYFLDKL